MSSACFLAFRSDITPPPPVCLSSPSLQTRELHRHVIVWSVGAQVHRSASAPALPSRLHVRMIVSFVLNARARFKSFSLYGAQGIRGVEGMLIELFE
eukprot:454860-Pleurochrysis_carterae.AAC.1